MQSESNVSNQKWAELPVEWLIFENEKFIVFLDRNLELDWVVEDSEVRTRVEGQEVGDFLSELACLRALPSSHLSREILVSYRSLVGEGVARAFLDDFETASSFLDRARDFITEKNSEIARLWYGVGSVAFTVPCIIFGITAWIFRSSFLPEQESVLHLFLAASVGTVGALSWTLLRLGNATLDPSAGKALHVFSALARAILGGIAGILLLLSVKSGFILPGLMKGGIAGILLLAFVSGATCENFIPALIKRIELQITPRKKRRKPG